MKINEMPELYTIFARKIMKFPNITHLPEKCQNITLCLPENIIKDFFFLGGGVAATPLPPLYMFMAGPQASHQLNPALLLITRCQFIYCRLAFTESSKSAKLAHLTPHQQRTPTNIDTSKDGGLHLCRWYESACILKQPCLKARASTLNDSTRKTIFNTKRLFKAIQHHLFRCRWKAVWGLHNYSDIT